jgi:hypothetical protein
MQAEIAIGVKLPSMTKYADFVLANPDDLALAILEFRRFADKLFSHSAPSRMSC